MTAQELIGMIDPTITLGNIIEISAIVGGGFLALIKLNNNFVIVQTNVVALKSDMATMQEEIKKIGDVLIQLAVTGSRLSNVEADIREIRAEARNKNHK